MDKKYFIPTLCITLLLLGNLLAQLPAFPGAEGSGMYSLGGRGGSVYEVTNLNNSGAGSIVDAVSQPNRTIVFRVSGVIALNGVILKPKSNTTIAGQTAPGDGICIKGRIQLSGCSNVIIRYIRVRVDEGAANSSGDAIDVAQSTNIIIDHVSASYARDEGISCTDLADKVTVQWCIISESLTFESHSYGSLVRGDSGDTKSYHHNLYAHINNRNPRPGNYIAASNDTLGLFFDFRNNVIYNWKGTYPGYNSDVNSISRYMFVGNVCIPGVESAARSNLFKEDATIAYGYFANNMYNDTIPSDPYNLVKLNGFTAEQIAAYKERAYILPMLPIVTSTPQQAKIDVLNSAGASLPVRETIDRRIVQDVIARTGHSIATTSAQPEGGWPTLISLPAPEDTDHDGMPNAWEIQNSLNPNNANDRNTISSNGYTMLEIYLNELVTGKPNGNANEISLLPSAFSLSQNFPNPFNPETRINFSLPSNADVKITITDILGKEIATPIFGKYPSGNHSFSFNASHLPTGMYIYTLQASGLNISKKFLFLK